MERQPGKLTTVVPQSKLSQLHATAAARLHLTSAPPASMTGSRLARDRDAVSRTFYPLLAKA